MDASQEALDALSSELVDQDAPALAFCALAGDLKGLVNGMTRVRSLGGSLAGVLRIALTKAMNVAEVRSAIEGGAPPNSALRVNGRPLFKREADEMTRLLRHWPGETIGRGVVRLAAAERASRGGAISETVIAQELLAVARQAARAR
jgi:DNA polymerase-3 subunit delta